MITHKELIQRGVKWLRNSRHYRYRSQIIITEFVSYANEIPDIFGMGHHHTNVIECKVTLSDFKADFKKGHRNHINSLGNWRMYLCPVGLIPVELVPEDWGLLYCHDKKITIEKQPLDHHEPEVRYEEYHVLYSIIRRVQIAGCLEKALRTLKEKESGKE